MCGVLVQQMHQPKVFRCLASRTAAIDRACQTDQSALLCYAEIQVCRIDPLPTVLMEHMRLF